MLAHRRKWFFTKEKTEEANCEMAEVIGEVTSKPLSRKSSARWGISWLSKTTPDLVVVVNNLESCTAAINKLYIWLQQAVIRQVSREWLEPQHGNRIAEWLGRIPSHIDLDHEWTLARKTHCRVTRKHTCTCRLGSWMDTGMEITLQSDWEEYLLHI